MKFYVLLPLLVLLIACAPAEESTQAPELPQASEPHPETAPDTSFPDSPVGSSFVSEELLDGGLGPDGPVPMHWRIEVVEQNGPIVRWHHSDVTEAIRIVITDEVNLSGMRSNDVPIHGLYDPHSGVLVWDNRRYLFEAGPTD